MTTAIDTNVIASLWGADPRLNRAAQSALDLALDRGPLVISGCVYAELLACPGRLESFVDRFLSDGGIAVEWELGSAVWRAAGRAFHNYSARRAGKRSAGSRRILADFLIGAHAAENNYRLLTLDDEVYRSAYPQLTLIVP